jgi:hypothetical protein
MPRSPCGHVSPRWRAGEGAAPGAAPHLAPRASLAQIHPPPHQGRRASRAPPSEPSAAKRNPFAPTTSRWPPSVTSAQSTAARRPRAQDLERVQRVQLVQPIEHRDLDPHSALLSDLNRYSLGGTPKLRWNARRSASAAPKPHAAATACPPALPPCGVALPPPAPPRPTAAASPSRCARRCERSGGLIAARGPAMGMRDRPPGAPPRTPPRSALRSASCAMSCALNCDWPRGAPKTSSRPTTSRTCAPGKARTATVRVLSLGATDPRTSEASPAGPATRKDHEAQQFLAHLRDAACTRGGRAGHGPSRYVSRSRSRSRSRRTGPYGTTRHCGEAARVAASRQSRTR